MFRKLTPVTLSNPRLVLHAQLQTQDQFTYRDPSHAHRTSTSSSNQPPTNSAEPQYLLRSVTLTGLEHVLGMERLLQFTQSHFRTTETPSRIALSGEIDEMNLAGLMGTEVDGERRNSTEI
ncbi:hypothetical protein Droror1_Dr00000985 [Drosera rotundifolia]